MGRLIILFGPSCVGKGPLSLKDFDDVETRANGAPGEFEQAWRFDWVIPNHEGEDSGTRDAFHHPLGDARPALLGSVALLQGNPPRMRRNGNRV